LKTLVIPDSMLSGVTKKNMLTAAQARRKEQMSKSYAATPALVMTQQVVEEARSHTIRWKAVGDKYAEYVHLMSSFLLVDFPALPVVLVDGAPDEVEPWPQNGLRYDVVLRYMLYYVENTPGIFGFKTVGMGTTKTHYALLYCAALRLCSFSANSTGLAASALCRKYSTTSMSLVGGGTKENMTPVLRALLLKMPLDYQEDRMVKDAAEQIDLDWILRGSHASPNANRASVVAGAVGLAELAGLRPGSMFESKEVAAPANAALEIAGNQTNVFRGMRLSHLEMSGFIQDDMLRVTGTVKVRHKKGNVTGEVCYIDVKLFPGVAGTCISVDGVANLFAMLFRLEVFARQKPGDTPEQQYDAIADNMDFTYKKGYKNYPLFPFVSGDGKVVREVSQSTKSALAALRSVTDPMGAEPHAVSWYNMRKFLAKYIQKSETGGTVKAKTALAHKLEGDAIKNYVRAGNLDTASIVRGEDQRQMLSKTSLQVNAISVDQQATVQHPEVQALIAKDRRVAEFEETLLPLASRTPQQKHTLWRKRKEVAEQCRVRVVRKQFATKRMEIARNSVWNHDTKCLKVFWNDPLTGERMSKVLSDVPAVSSMTLKEFVVSRSASRWRDETCLEIMNSVVTVPVELRGHMAVRRLPAEVIHEMFDDKNSTVSKKGTRMRTTFDCAQCKRDDVTFVKTMSLQDMWVHQVVTNRPKSNPIFCKSSISSPLRPTIDFPKPFIN